MRNDSCRKNCDNCDRDRNGDEIHQTVILQKKRVYTPFCRGVQTLGTTAKYGLKPCQSLGRKRESSQIDGFWNNWQNDG